MADLNLTVLEVINHVLNKHPELAPKIEELAVIAQGKNQQDLHDFREWQQFRNLSNKEIFEKIYAEGHWGKSTDPSDKFYSGSGSRTEDIVSIYIDTISKFLSSLDHKPDVVDLGCGDFFIGSKIRPLCNKYIACDIVDSLIAFNKEKFSDINVDFRTLDFINDALPQAEIVFIRQALQHLSNQDIIKLIPKLINHYHYLILTEHLPLNENYTPNIDKPTGKETRIVKNSGVDLIKPPFNLPILESTKLCEIEISSGRVTTILYRLN